MKTNVKATGVKTYEGGAAIKSSSETELRRAVMCCLLWEDTFYEDGVAIADRIKGLVQKCSPEFVSSLAVEARSQFYLRHVPLFLCVQLARSGNLHKWTLEQVIQRPDELTEFLSLYWQDGKCPLSNQVKKGLATAFLKFDEYQLAKYNRKNTIKLRDIMRLVHPVPRDDKQADMFGRLLSDELKTPDTWEVALSATDDKKAEWTRLLSENKLGGMALLRNLRNMQQAGVDRRLIRKAIKNMRTDKILPFRFISAANYAPDMEDVLEEAMVRSLQEHKKLSGHTVLLVDNSGSMYYDRVSSKSDLTRTDAACALAIMLREICEDITILAFANGTTVVPNRTGFALRDAIKGTPSGGTYLGDAVRKGNSYNADRVIVLTDEQSHDTVGASNANLAYMLNVASYQNGVGYGDWTRINGWSENVIRYIMECEV